ncbi:MAG: proton-conducting transporter membrane subunit [Desulfurivibrionaceae bacterium]|nr:proton-conducting transporter membrane subunit [Desulfurivibrionaceae bacterium]
MSLSPASSSWVIWPVVVPLLGTVVCFLYKKKPCLAAHFFAVVTCGTSTVLGWQVLDQGVGRHLLGGWSPPLGISLRADGPAALMVMMTAVTGLGITLYSGGYFQSRLTGGSQDRRFRAQEQSFWPLWLLLWAALNGLFLSGDIFNIYISLELVALSSVGLTALSGKPPSLVAAMRYLLVSLLGSLTFLLGVGFFYKAHGTLELAVVSRVLAPTPPVIMALVLVSVGLMLKTALFPFHFWLPPAHANALAPVSAILSALVVKGSWYLCYRFWQGGGLPAVVGVVPALLGSAAIIWGAFQAFSQQRLKMLVAYSTVAQIGYLFVAFPLLADPAGQGSDALFYFAISHSCAKAAMFLAAGTFFLQMGHDRIRDLAGVRQLLPVSSFAFALGGLSLMGLPPSGGFIAKYLLVTAAISQDLWWLGLIAVLGSGLTAVYVFRAVSSVLSPHLLEEQPALVVAASMQWSALALALLAIVLGIMAPLPLALLEVT